MSDAMTRTRCARLEPEDLRARIPTPEGKRFLVGLERGELVVEFYAPHREDH